MVCARRRHPGIIGTVFGVDMGEPGIGQAGTEAEHARSAEVELAHRILASETLRRSGRLKELLAYLLSRAADGPHTQIREQEIVSLASLRIFGSPVARYV